MRRIHPILVMVIIINIALPCKRLSAQCSPSAYTVTTSNFVVNTYFPITASCSAGATSITIGTAIGATTPITKGDLLLVMQMQDATINSTNTNSYGDGVSGGSASGFLTSTAGRYEYAIAFNDVPITGGTLTVSTGLTNAYSYAAATSTQGQVRAQVIRVQRYSSLTFNSASSIIATAWNGLAGGVVAIEVTGTITISGLASINANGKGFRGGGGRQLGGGTGANTDIRTLSTVNNNGSKGEGIAGTPRYLFDGTGLVNTGVEGYPNGSNGNGAPGNAGGGATDGNAASNDENTGGGGGANGGAGGRGGRSWNSALNLGGYGGAAAGFLATSRLIMGGGGGAGSNNDGTGTLGSGLSSSGGTGGGIIILKMADITGTLLVSANGSNGGSVDNDGAGGAGAGGTIYISCTNTSNLTNITANAIGGNGGNAWPTVVDAGSANDGNPEFGPGGGGGGGVIYANGNLNVSSSVAGGSNGITTTSNLAFSATSGVNGIKNQAAAALIFGNNVCDENWTGATNTDWNTATNWDRNAVPASFTNVSIPLVANQPSLTANGFCNNLNLASGTLLTVGNNILNLYGSITSNQAIDATNGTIAFNGSTSQTIPSSAFTNNTINGLTINNAAGVTLAGTLNVKSLLTAMAGTFTTGNFLTLKSSSILNTAMVANGVGIISGNVTLERYIPAKRAFRLLSPGVTTTTNIKANWQEGQNNTTTASNSNTNVGFGTHITGSTSGSNGFDATITGSASLFNFSNTSANTWTQIPSTATNTLNALSAYRLLIRGSRSINLNSNTATPDATILRATGVINNSSSVVFNSTSSPTALNTSTVANQNFSLIPNPYWSTINWATITKSGIGSAYYIWDPTQGTRGAYTSWNGTVASAGSMNQYIQPGQAFFVTSTTSTPSLTIQQSDKVVLSSNLTETFRNQKDIITLRLSLYYLDASNKAIQADGATAIFGQYSAQVRTDEEAYKPTNLDEMLSINRNGTLLSIEARPVPTTDNDTLPLSLFQLTQTKYYLQIAAENFPLTNRSGYIVDRYLNKNYPLNMGGTSIVPFELLNDPASKISDRFIVVLGKSSLMLPSTHPLTIKLSPNPADGFLLCSYEGLSVNENSTLQVVSAEGKIMQTIELGKIQSGQQSISTKLWGSGLYTLQLLNGTNRQSVPFIKQ